jgi:SAM-dependent methyltransferase
MEDVDLTVDITDMEAVPSELYDIFICSHVLEHVTDDKKALLELFRILKPGGFGILMVPIILSKAHIDEDPTVKDPEIRWRRFGQDDHVRLYSKTGFIQRIQEAGFIINQYGVEYFGADVFVESGISLRSVLYVAQKSIQ